MKHDSIQTYIALRESLLKERATLEAKLSRINEALKSDGHVPAVRAAKPTSPKPAKRTKNRLSLKAAITEVTKAKPLTKPEILAAVKKLGYKFGGAKPINSLNVVLYSKRQFKNSGGKFGPAS